VRRGLLSLRWRPPSCSSSVASRRGAIVACPRMDIAADSISFFTTLCGERAISLPLWVRFVPIVQPKSAGRRRGALDYEPP